MFPGCHTSGERKDIVMMIELVLQDLHTARVRILFLCAFLKIHVSWIFSHSSISVVLFSHEYAFFIFLNRQKEKETVITLHRLWQKYLINQAHIISIQCIFTLLQTGYLLDTDT